MLNDTLDPTVSSATLNEALRLVEEQKAEMDYTKKQLTQDK